MINCRNCGAPRDSKCHYCGTVYDTTIVPKGVNKNNTPLTKKQILALTIGLFIFPLYLYKKRIV